MKKLLPLLLTTMLFMSPFLVKVEAESIKSLQEDLAELEANREENERKEAEARERAKKYQEEIKASVESIDQFGKEIAESKQKIKDLEVEIADKEEEIKELLSFLQLTNGENVYLEYVFGATDFTDFIFRTAVVEQLSNHNDELIIEMNNLIEENKQLQEELNQKIKDEEKAIKDFEKKLKEANVEVSNIEGFYVKIDDKISSIKKQISDYQNLGCEVEEEVNDCIIRIWQENNEGEEITISATDFNIPIRSGTVTSEWGYRTLYGESDFHNGIDLGTPEGTKVYASTFGIVKNLIYKASCGGNIVYIEHTVNGKKYTTRYLHLLRYTVEVGQIVTPATVIGYSGGSSTAEYNGGYDYCTFGAHLHFEIRKEWGSEKGYWNIVSVDPRDHIDFPYSW